jgi:hypothetical protein
LNDVPKDVLLEICKTHRRLGVRIISESVSDLLAQAFDVGLDLAEIHLTHSNKRKKQSEKRSRRKGRSAESEEFCQACSDDIDRRFTKLVALTIERLDNRPAKGKKAKSSAQGSNSAERSTKKARTVKVAGDPFPSIVPGDGSTMECEICCLDDVPLKNMTQCPEGHVFCFTCARKMAETQIGMQKVDLPCMSMEGCEASFTEAEMRRFLEPKTMGLWVRLKAKEDISSASIDGLVTCPFCEYMVIIEGDIGSKLQCGNPECRKVSCPSCKQLAHDKLSCEEARERGSLNDRQKAEEELAEALIRRCPKCSMALLKDESYRGCNKMTCTKCHAVICYICRLDITGIGYAHFDDQGGWKPQSSKAAKKCPLYDDTAARHSKELETIRQKLGDLAPTMTDIDKRDAKRRQKRFEKYYGPGALAVRNYAQEAVHQAGPANEPGLNALDLEIEREMARRAERDERAREAWEDYNRLAAERDLAAEEARVARRHLYGFEEFEEAPRHGGAGVRFAPVPEPDIAPAQAQPVQPPAMAQSITPPAAARNKAHRRGVARNLQHQFRRLPEEEEEAILANLNAMPPPAHPPAAQPLVAKGSRKGKAKLPAVAVDLTQATQEQKAKPADRSGLDKPVIQRVRHGRRDAQAEEAAYAMMNMQHREPIPKTRAAKGNIGKARAIDSEKDKKGKGAARPNVTAGHSPSQAINIDVLSSQVSEPDVKCLRGGKTYGIRSASSSPVYVGHKLAGQKEVSTGVAGGSAAGKA